MKWTNQVENRVLIIGTMFVMIFLFAIYQNKFIKPIYKAQNEMMQQLIESQNRLIATLAQDPKYSIQNDFGKMKPKEGSIINLDLDNDLNVKDSRSTTLNGDTINIAPVVKKKTFWQKLFNSN